MLLHLVPKVFFDRLDDGLDLFVGALGFGLDHRDSDFAIVSRDGAKAHVVQSADDAAKDRPELAIETDTIDALFNEIEARAPQLLHPNLRTVTLRPWGAREFAVLDPTGVCVVFREWAGRD